MNHKMFINCVCYQKETCLTILVGIQFSYTAQPNTMQQSSEKVPAYTCSYVGDRMISGHSGPGIQFDSTSIRSIMNSNMIA